MKRLPTIALAALALASLQACSDSQAGAKEDASVTQTAVAEPTLERLVERCNEYWQKKADGDWIAVYDYSAPSQRDMVDISMFLQGKTNFNYHDPLEPTLIALEGELGYLLTRASFTPEHPVLKSVELEDGQSLTQKIEMIETWAFEEGDWYHQSADRKSDFYQEHPELLKDR